jgi:very-short-patch-repair endonuclease
MPRPRPLPPALQAQPFTIRQATAAGLTRRRTRALDLASPCHGVRAPAAVEITLLIRARGLALATGAVVSHLSAAALWGFPLPLHFEDHKTIHLTSRGGARAVRRKNVCGHRLPLAEDEIFDGRYVACTSPLRTWFDLAGILSLQDLVIAGDFLLRRKGPISTPDALDSFLEEKKGRAGYPKAMKARALIRANTDSPKETELRLLLTAAGLPEPGINVPMFDETGGWVQDPDMSYEDFKIAIQYDGGHHATPAQRRSDIYRDENARSLGWLVVVLTQLDLDPLVPGMEPSAITKVRRALTSRGWKRAG